MNADWMDDPEHWLQPFLAGLRIEPDAGCVRFTPPEFSDSEKGPNAKYEFKPEITELGTIPSSYFFLPLF